MSQPSPLPTTAQAADDLVFLQEALQEFSLGSSSSAVPTTVACLPSPTQKTCPLANGKHLCCPGDWTCPASGDPNPTCNNKCLDTFGGNYSVRCISADRKVDVCCPAGSVCAWGPDRDPKNPCYKVQANSFQIFPYDRCTQPEFPQMCGRFQGNPQPTCCPAGATCVSHNNCCPDGKFPVPGDGTCCPQGWNASWSASQKKYRCCPEGQFWDDTSQVCLFPGDVVCSTDPLRVCPLDNVCQVNRIPGKTILDLPKSVINCCPKKQACGNICCAATAQCDPDTKQCEFDVKT